MAPADGLSKSKYNPHRSPPRRSCGGETHQAEPAQCCSGAEAARTSRIGTSPPTPPRHDRALRRCVRWWARQDSNLQPDRYERPALTIELQAPAAIRVGELPWAANGLKLPFS